MIATARVTLQVAKKMMTNQLKHIPAFKPEKGEHGNCSWFLASGTPYTGVDDSKNIDIVVFVDDEKVVAMDKATLSLEREAKRGEAREDQTEREQRRQEHRATWDGIGDYAHGSKYGLVKLWVEQGEMSQSGKGYFLVVSQEGAQYVGWKNYEDVKSIIGREDPNFFNDFDARNEEKEKERGKVLTVVIRGLNHDGDVQAALAELWQYANTNLHKVVHRKAVKREYEAAPKAEQGVPRWGAKPLAFKLYELQVSLSYDCYRGAREAFKALRRKQPVPYEVTPPENWPEKQKTVVNFRNQPI